MELLGQSFFIEVGMVTIVILTGFSCLTVYTLWRCYINIKVLRYELISFSDWSAITLKQISDSATDAVVNEVLKHKPHLSRSDAEGYVPYDVSGAVRLWEEAIDNTQAGLARNGIKQLNLGDKLFPLSEFYKY
jgi:hypothetical protein